MKTQTKADSVFTAIEDGIFLKEGAEHIKILYADIHYLQADGDYTRIYLKNARRYVTIGIGALFAKLPAMEFIKVHKSFVVNLKEVTSYKQKHLHIGDQEIPISRSHKAEFLKRVAL